MALFFILGGVQSAHAYEWEHYYWTYYLAVHMGFTERQAYQIASAAIAIDWAPATGPMPASWVDTMNTLAGAPDESLLRVKWREFHAFFDFDFLRQAAAAGRSPQEINTLLAKKRKDVENRRWNTGIAQGNVGGFIHFLQDEYSHGSWGDMYAHASASHIPDFLSADPMAARGMTVATANALASFWKDMCASGTKYYCNTPVRGAPVMAEIQPVLGRLIAVNPLPFQIADFEGLMRDMHAFSFSFTAPDGFLDSAMNIATVAVGMDYYLAKAGVTDNGLPVKGYKWLKQMPPPDRDKTYDVIVNAMRDDRRAALRGDAHMTRDFSDPRSWGEAGSFTTKLPYKWFEYGFDAVGRITDAPELVAIEDPQPEISNDKVEIERTKDANDVEYYRVTISFDLAVNGLAPIPFIPELPVVLYSDPQAVDMQYGGAEQIQSGRLADGKRVTFRETRDFPVEDYNGKKFNWTVKSDIYSLPAQPFVFEIDFTESQSGAECNSAVDSGGDEGGGVTVDLGGFVGKAGFTWQMYNVKDQMDVTVGGQTMTTGCVSGTGTFAIDIPPGANTATVNVVPNCEGTTGTQWVLKFECPLESEVTSDGQGHLVDGGTSGNGSGAGSILTGAGASSIYAGAMGVTTGLVQSLAPTQITETEPNNTGALATLGAVSAIFNGLILAANDVDNYLIDAPQGGELTLTIALNTPTNSLSIGIHPAGGGNWLPDRSAKGDGMLVVDLPAAGKYLLEVKDPSAKQGNLAYRIAGAFKPSPDQHEPNNADAIAVLTPVDGTLVGAISPAGDHDYFKLNVNRPGQWTIAVNGQPDGFKTALGVHPAGGGNWLPNRSEKPEGELVVDLPWAGEYLLRVTEANGQRSPDPYVLGLSFKAANDNGEPNNSGAIATPVSGTGSITGTVLTAGDEDHYSFEAPDQGEWTITIASQPQAMAVGLGVYPAGGGNWLPDRSDKGDGKLVVDLPSAGKYVLRVKDDNGGRSIEPYTLDLGFKPTGDGYEPNHNVSVAPQVPPDGALSGTILPAGDQDYYLVEVPDQGEWTIAIADAPQIMALGLGVHPAGGGNWLPDRSDKGDGKLVVDLPAPGKYVLRVVDDNSGRSIAPYTLDLGFKPTGDGYEPNNNSATAKPIAPDSALHGAILPAGDQDFYLVDVPDQGEWTIRLDNEVNGISPSFGVHPAGGGNWLPDLSPKGDGQLVVDLPSAGKYILRIVDEFGGRSIAPYDVTTRFVATGDAGEPNHNATLATPIATTGTIGGTILPKGDDDYYIFEAAQGGQFTAVIASQPQGFALELGVHPAAGGNWLSDKSPRGDGQLVVDLPAPGRYVLRVRDGNGGRSPSPYSISTSLQ